MDVHRYLDRIGYSGPTEPTLATLSAVHRAHMLSVPFENLDIHLGIPIVLDEESFHRKIVEARRGGFCYELNGLFAATLRRLGFDLDLLSARVARGDGGFGPEFDHLTLLVRLGHERWLADVGFGDLSLEPIRLDHAGEQTVSGFAFEVVHEAGRVLLLRREQGRLEQKYVFSLTPRRLEEFAGMCHYHQTSPASHFTQKKLCTLATERGRITLSGLRLITTEDGRVFERDLRDDEYAPALRQHFGIDLPRTTATRA